MKTPLVKKNVLLIEDEADHLFLILKAFENHSASFHILKAENLKQAKLILAKEKIDIIIADMLLPDGKGVELLSHKKVKDKIPVIIMTSQGNEQMAVNALRAGAANYIVKSSKEFTNMPHQVEQVLREKKLISQKQDIQKKLEENEERYRIILNTVQTGICIIDPATQKITDSNPLFENLVGLPHLEIKGCLFGDFFELNNIDEIDNQLVNFETTLKTVSGAKIPILVNQSKVTIKEKDFIIISFVDISKQKETEESLIDSENYFRLLFEAAPDGIVLFNKEGYIENCNENELKIFGYTKEEYIGKHFSELIDPQYHELLLGQLEEFKNLKPAYNEIEGIKKDGSKFWLSSKGVPLTDKSGKFYKVLAYDRDITEKKIAEKQLAFTYKTLEQERNLFVSGSVIVFKWKNEPGMPVEYVSPNVKNIFGYTDQEFLEIKIKFKDLIHPEDKEKVDESVLKNQDVDRFSTEPYRIISKDKKEVYVADYTNIIRDENGKITFYLTYLLDISDRVKSEKALLESEQKLKNIVSNAPAVIFVIDKKGIFTLSEGKGLELLNLKPGEVVGVSAFELYKDTPEIIDSIKKALNGTVCNTVVNYNETYFNTVYTPLNDADDNTYATIGMAIDVTESYNATIALKESEARFRAVFDSAKDSIFIKDKNLKYTLVNPGMEKLLGKTNKEIIGKTDIELFGEITGSLIQAEDKNILKGQSLEDEISIPINNQIHTFASVKVPMRNVNEEIIGLCGIARDISERYKTQEAIRKSEERLELALEGADLGLWDWDITNNIVTTNKRWVEMMGLTVDQLEHTKENWEQLIHPDDIKDALTAFEEHLNDKRDFYEARYRIKHTSGEWLWILDKGKIVERDEDGKPIRVTGTHLDITEIKRLQDQEARAQRLELSGKIAGQVAHDFNNLLGPIMAYPELIKEWVNDNEQAIKYIDDIEAAAVKIAEINQELLTLGRRGSYVIEPANVNEIIDQTIRQLGKLPSSLQITLDLHPDLNFINCSNSQVFRALSNLIINARDAMGDKGTIIISTENIQISELLEPNLNIKKGDYIKITVSDTGHGISESDLEKMYDPFFTTKIADKKRGSGLGLSVVHAVIKDHYGFIDCASTINKGTSFYLYFPTTQNIYQREAQTDIKKGTESILIIDDEVSQRDVMEKLLIKLGYSPFTVDTGEKAIKFLKKQKVDLAVVDMVLQNGIDGAETIKQLREITPNQKTLIVSGFAQGDRIEAAIKFGAGEFLKKPFHLNSFSNAVRKVLDNKDSFETIKEKLLLRLENK